MPSKPQRSSPLRLSVIIVNYNVRDFLHHALASLHKAMKGIRGEVFVVDNASDDGSVAMVRSRFPGVRLIVNQENLGFAKANNIALQKTRGEYVLLLNPDTVVQEDTLRVMMKFFDENPDAGIAGCRILNPDGSFQLACRRSFPSAWVAFTRISGLATLFPSSRMFGKYNLTYLSPDETYEVDAVSGSFMMIRRDAFKAVGGLDERFFMYGEDLDWCYRVQKAGWKNYYVHSTKIIHYKGESTRRSSIDEIRMFYDAMHLFVAKHLGASPMMKAVVTLGIIVSSRMAMVRQFLKPLSAAFVDGVLIVLSLMVAEYVRMGELFHFPAYAYPAVYTVPTILILLGLYSAGVYTYRRDSLSRTFIVVFVSYVGISALVAFFKEYAFSRIAIVLAGAITMMALPGWRLMARSWGKSAGGVGSLFGRRTLIVGADDSGRALCKRLRHRVADGYEVVGFIDFGRRRIGEMVDGIPILGSVDMVGKIVGEHAISDVIFSTERISYADIVSVIGRTSRRSVNYHLVPSSLEVMIGKASISPLSEPPLVQISYSINRWGNRALKRISDVVIAGILLISFYPFVYFRRALNGRSSPGFILGLPAVLAGRKSLVGPPEQLLPSTSQNGHESSVSLGKPGLTGLVQLQDGRPLTPEEIEQYHLYYARNQSFLLDLEILMKSMFRTRKQSVAAPAMQGRERTKGKREVLHGQERS